MMFLVSRLETFIQIIVRQIIRQTSSSTFSITLDKNFRLDTGRRLKKSSKSRDGFFSRGDNTAFFVELRIEAELNERFTTFLIIGSRSSIQ